MGGIALGRCVLGRVLLGDVNPVDGFLTVHGIIVVRHNANGTTWDISQRVAVGKINPKAWTKVFSSLS